MKFYLKNLSVVLALFLAFGCSEDDNLNATSPSGFVLKTPEASNINLNFAYPDNPAFTLVWTDNLTNADSYSIEMATEAEFLSPITLGSSNSRTFTMSVSEFNNSLLAAGVNAYENASVFMKVTAGGMSSNSVVFSVNSYSETPPVITNPSNGTTVTLSDATPEEVALVVDWEDPDFNNDLGSTQVDIHYVLESALQGTDFSSIVNLGNVDNAFTISIIHSALNNAALTAGILPDEMGSLDLRIKATIITASGDLVRYSDSISISVTPYSTSLGLATWGVVGSGYNNWGAFTDAPFYTTEQPNVFVTYVTLVTGEIKFRENNDWGNNMGDDGADGTLEADGANIAVTDGTYKITLNLNDNTYSMEPFYLGVVGSGYNDWGGAGPDAKFYYDYTTNTFKIGVKLLDGEIKFRMNNDWGVNYGDAGGGSIGLDANNIAVTAGHYSITVDLENLTYSIVADDILGIVGSGYNDWGGAGPDFALTEVHSGVWVGDIATLITGEIKFRANNDWGLNYGDDGADGTLEVDGANIAVNAGLYRIRIDMSDSTYQINQVQ